LRGYDTFKDIFRDFKIKTLALHQILTILKNLKRRTKETVLCKAVNIDR